MANSNPPDMKIRISAALRQRIEDAAKQNNRTMNGEVSDRLERSFESEAVADARSKEAADRLLRMSASRADPLEDRVTALEAEVAALKRQLSKPECS